MKLRVIAVLLLTSILAGLLGIVASATPSDQYYVGYAKVDINPYDFDTPDPNDLLAIPMAGNGFADRRLSYEGKMDDNGDGVVDENDGIFATCIAITDSDGNTMLQFCLDIVNASAHLVNPIRQQLVMLYPELRPDRIMINANHTHNGPDLGTGWANGYDFSEDFVQYWEHLIDQIVLAGKLAMEDRAPATMYKGTLEANDSKAARSDIGDTLNEGRPADNQVTVRNGEDYPDRIYNSVRHYEVTAQGVKRIRFTGGATNNLTLSDGTEFPRYPYYYYIRPYAPDPTTPLTTYVGGDNFNGVAAVGGTSFPWTYVDKDGNQVDEAYYVQNAVSGNAFWKAEGLIISNVEQVSETDDTMLILEFRFDEQYNKKPIALINWRAHSTLNRMVSDDYDELIAEGKYQDLGFYSSYFQISSDWSHAMCYVLERNGYRPAFLQGAAGNVNANSRLSDDSGWFTADTEGDRTYATNRGNIYGSELAEVALECLREHMVQINKNGGNIKIMQVKYQTERQQVDTFEYLAALDYKARYNPAKPLGNQKYTNLYYYTDADNNILVDKDTGHAKVDVDGNAVLIRDVRGNLVLDDQGNPQYYTDSSGKPVVGIAKYNSSETFIITSVHHAGAVIRRYASNGTKSAALELNAVAIGQEFAMVTAPNELFDRYSETATQQDMSDNLWLILHDNTAGSYGEPFVAGYSNASHSYLPSSATYSFSEDNPNYATGAYETLTSQFAQGNGEAVVRTFKAMLDRLHDQSAPEAVTRGGYCDHCNAEVIWTALTEDTSDLVIPNIDTGHYYLSQNSTLDGKQTLIGANVCLDLDGHILTVRKGLTVSASSTLSILGQGTVAGTDGPANGGVLPVEQDGTLNLYEATVCYVGEATREGPINNGGILNIAGTFNMYGGTIQGTTIYWTGGAAYVSASGRMNLYGGKILEASSDRDSHVADCIVNRGTVLLSGDAQVDDLFFMYNTGEGGPAMADALIIQGKYTGRVNLTFQNSYKTKDIGNSIHADCSTASITVNGEIHYYPMPTGENLMCISRPPMVLVNDAQGIFSSTGSLSTAFNSCTENDRIVLLRNITNLELTYALPKSATLDLNGHSMNLPLCRMKNGCTLYVMDSSTADYDISDGIYGKLTLKSGNIVGVSATEDRDVHIKLLEEDGSLSFHAVGLNIHAMSLKADSAGLYYENNFLGDSAVKAKIRSYGVAVSVQEAPTAETMGSTAKFTVMPGETFGQGTSTSTLLYGIMKSDNNTANNRLYASMKVYGRAYVELDNGEYLFGVTRTRSLQEQVELADEKYFYKYRDSLILLYNTYSGVMHNWNLPNLNNFLSKQ